MLLPSLQQAKSKAHAISCLSNLKQIELGLSSYVNNYSEYYPPMIIGGWQAPFWQDQLLDTFPDTASNKPNAIFFCPSEPKHHSIADYGCNQRIIANLTSSGWGALVSLTQIKRPTEIAMVMDSRENSGTVGSWYTNVNSSSFYNSPLAYTGAGPTYSRHGNGMNYLYCDGHAGFVHAHQMASSAKDMFAINAY